MGLASGNNALAGIDVPPAWERLDLAHLAGTIVVIGPTDSGKTTFVRWLVAQLCRHHERAGWLDADVGQSTLGLPTTLNLAVVSEPQAPAPAPDACFFVGNTSPRGHMLPAIVGAHKLQQRAQQIGAGAIVVDTTGLVDQAAGGGALKQWKIELMSPTTVVAIQQHGELVHILTPLVRDPRLKVHTLTVVEAVNRKSVEERTQRRQRRFRRYFADASRRTVHYSRFPVYGLEEAGPQRVVALQDSDGFALGLGIIEKMNTREMTILTPVPDDVEIRSLRVGAVRLNPQTGEERH